MAISDAKQYKLEQTKDSSTIVTLLLAIFLSPLAYLYLGRYKWAILCLLTINYGFLGHVLVPFHALLLKRNSKKKLATE